MPHVHLSPQPAPTPRAPSRREGERGFGLLEVSLALLVIAVATLGSVSWTLSGMNLEAANREEAAANDALRQLCEELHAMPFDEVFVRCNHLEADDPDGPGTTRGGAFTIEPTRAEGFLDPARTPAADAVRRRSHPLQVELSFPTGPDGRLLETAQGGRWGDHAWDLDGDGRIGEEAVSGSYRLLPVRIRITWQGSKGRRTIEHVRLMSRRIRPEADE